MNATNGDERRARESLECERRARETRVASFGVRVASFGGEGLEGGGGTRGSVRVRLQHHSAQRAVGKGNGKTLKSKRIPSEAEARGETTVGGRRKASASAAFG